MKKLLIMAFAFISSMAFAQTNKHTSEEDLIQSFFGKAKQVVVGEYMSSLPDAVKPDFWKIYEMYENERQALIRERFEHVADYIYTYGALNDESAKKIMNALLKNDEQLVKLEKNYLKKMSKAIGGIQATKFFQLENFLRNWMFAQIQGDIPSIDNLTD